MSNRPVTATNAARHLGISERTFHRRAQEPKGPVVANPGESPAIWMTDELDHWVAERAGNQKSTH